MDDLPVLETERLVPLPLSRHSRHRSQGHGLGERRSEQRVS